MVLSPSSRSRLPWEAFGRPNFARSQTRPLSKRQVRWYGRHCGGGGLRVKSAGLFPPSPPGRARKPYQHCRRHLTGLLARTLVPGPTSKLECRMNVALEQSDLGTRQLGLTQNQQQQPLCSSGTAATLRPAGRPRHLQILGPSLLAWESHAARPRSCPLAKCLSEATATAR